MIQSLSMEQNSATPECLPEAVPNLAAGDGVLHRKEKRKVLKKEKRKQKRKELAEKARQEQEARLNDIEEQRRIQLEEERENERMERERKEFEERERLFLEALARRKAEEEEEERKRVLEEEESKQNQVKHENDLSEDDGWEYVEEGPPEIIWQGNEIIVKKKKVRVKKKDLEQLNKKEDPNRPTSNPLPPQSEAFADHKNASTVSAQQLLDNVAQQIPNFGTEQDKAHCPFHLKTGACRFGPRCSRVHFYPDKSCTLLIKNMYNGPGLAWEQDEGLEYTDEEVERCYEEFYEDVHTELLKFGEIVNFKVCRNGSFHLRGNVYIHYKSLDSAVLAYHSLNGRYFAGKQLNFEFVSVTRWKVAICGEYMKSRLKTCSHGTACNFIHCFRNPGGDYEWADWDKPPPRYWVKKMTALFGHTDQSPDYDRENSGNLRSSSTKLASETNRSHSRRHRSNERDCSSRSSRQNHDEHDDRRSEYQKRHTKRMKFDERNAKAETHFRNRKRKKNITLDSYSHSDSDDYNEETFSNEKNHRSHSRSKRRGTVDVDFLDLKSGEKSEISKHSRSDRRNENRDVESRDCLGTKKMRLEKHVKAENGKSDLYDSGCFLEKSIDESGRWKPDKVVEEEQEFFSKTSDSDHYEQGNDDEEVPEYGKRRKKKGRETTSRAKRS